MIRPRRIYIHNYDPKLVDELIRRYGKPKEIHIGLEEVELVW